MNREKKWDKIFNAFVKLSQNLHDERQFLEDKIKSMHDTIHEVKSSFLSLDYVVSNIF